jgi:hypothetical protein
MPREKWVCARLDELVDHPSATGAKSAGSQLLTGCSLNMSTVLFFEMGDAPRSMWLLQPGFSPTTGRNVGSAGAVFLANNLVNFYCCSNFDVQIFSLPFLLSTNTPSVLPRAPRSFGTRTSQLPISPSWLLTSTTSDQLMRMG